MSFLTNKNMNLNATISVVVVCYYLKLPELVRSIKHFIENIDCEFDSIDLCVVMNRRCDDSELRYIKQSKIRFVSSVGPFFDISSYASVCYDLNVSDLYLFMNDTVFLKHPSALISKRFSAVKNVVSKSNYTSVAGVVNPSTDLLMFDEVNPSRRHLSTFSFLMNKSALEVFKSLASSVPIVFHDETVSSWINNHVSERPAIGRLLFFHLFGPDNPWSWKATKNTERSLTILYKKAVTVIFEYLFTVKLLQDGGVIVPVNVGVKYKILNKLSKIKLL